MTSPEYSSGVTTSTFMIGSSSTGFALPEAFLEAHGACDLERHFARVDVVVRAVEQRDLDVDDGIAGDDAGLDRLPDALVDRRDVFRGIEPPTMPLTNS